MNGGLNIFPYSLITEYSTKNYKKTKTILNFLNILLKYPLISTWFGPYSTTYFKK